MNREARKIQVEGRTVELAVQKAALELSVPASQIEYQLVKQSSGLMTLFTGKKVEIAAWVKSEPAKRQGRNLEGARSAGRDDNYRSGGRRGRRHDRDDDRSGDRRQDSRDFGNSDDSDAQDSESTRSGPPPRQLSAEELEGLRKEILGFFVGICESIAREKVEATARIEGGRLILEAENEYLADQLSRNGRLAEALEHILRKKPRHLRQELPFRVFVDISGVRAKRETELVDLAKELSAKVHDSKRPVVLNSRSPYERKVIHMALDKDERVYTKSVGSGNHRKLMILPIGEKYQRGDEDSAELHG